MLLDGASSTEQLQLCRRQAALQQDHSLEAAAPSLACHRPPRCGSQVNNSAAAVPRQSGEQVREPLDATKGSATMQTPLNTARRGAFTWPRMATYTHTHQRIQNTHVRPPTPFGGTARALYICTPARHAATKCSMPTRSRKLKSLPCRTCEGDQASPADALLTT